MTLQKALTSYWFWFPCYVIMITGIIIGILRFKEWTGSVYDTPSAKTNWQTWRDDVQNMPESSPVMRKVPRSKQPPALVLLSDHFWACLGISMVLSSALFLTFMVAVRGAILSPGSGTFDGDG